MANSNDKDGVKDIVERVNPVLTMCNSESAERDLQLSLTRVMSPSPNLEINESQLMKWGMRGIALPCGICEGEAADPWVCSACYISGHEGCLNPKMIEGYAFCIRCLPWAMEQASRFQSQRQRQMWNVRLAGQLANWRSTVVNTAGALGGSRCSSGWRRCDSSRRN